MIQILENNTCLSISQTILSLNTQKSTNHNPLEQFTVKPKFALSSTRSHYCFLQHPTFKNIVQKGEGEFALILQTLFLHLSTFY